MSAEVDETAALIDFVAVCRTYASELAINEVTLRTYSDLQQYVEKSTEALVQALRGGEGKGRALPAGAGPGRGHPLLRRVVRRRLCVADEQGGRERGDRRTQIRAPANQRVRSEIQFLVDCPARDVPSRYDLRHQICRT